jgi:acyl dehydratase
LRFNRWCLIEEHDDPCRSAEAGEGSSGVEVPGTFPIEVGHILMFARAIGDPNPVYDFTRARDTAIGEVIAPPTFLRAAVQFDPAYRWAGVGGDDGGRARMSAARGMKTRGLHAEQHFEYYRHPRAGETLTFVESRGRTWERVGRRAGRLAFTEMVTEFGDADGEIVAVARHIGVQTERPPRQGALSSAAAPGSAGDGGQQAGEVHEAVVLGGLTRTQIVQYAGASGDFSPIHTDEQFAIASGGYPSVFAHGMLTMGVTGHLVTDVVGDGTLTQFGGRFRAQVWPGDTLVSRVTVTGRATDNGTSMVDLTVVTVNDRGDVVFAGYARARDE